MALMKLDTSGFTEILKKIDELGGDINQIVEKTLKKAGDKINRDTEDAMAMQNLPASGRYSGGQTKSAVITDAQVRWDGNTAYVPIGFDFSKVYKYNENLIYIDFDAKVPSKKVFACGVKLGEVIKNRFEPHHQFFKC